MQKDDRNGTRTRTRNGTCCVGYELSFWPLTEVQVGWRNGRLAQIAFDMAQSTLEHPSIDAPVTRTRKHVTILCLITKKVDETSSSSFVSRPAAHYRVFLVPGRRYPKTKRLVRPTWSTPNSIPYGRVGDIFNRYRFLIKYKGATHENQRNLLSPFTSRGMLSSC
ncbi:unnamed protein product, partial [Aureobasidium pullulans]